MNIGAAHARARVLMVSDVYFPRVNGVSTSIRTFRADLESAGYGSLLVAPAYPGADDGDDEAGIVRIPSRYLPFDPEDRLMRRAAALEACGRLAGQVDVVHIQTPFVAHKVGIEIAARLGLPIVETYHTYFEQYLHHYLPAVPKAWLQRLARRISRTQCNAVDRVVAPSEDMKALLRGYGITVPIDVIPTGLDLDDFAAGDRQRFRRWHGVASDRPVLLHVGRMAFEKNLGFIIGVLERVRAAMPDVLLIVAGEGPALPAVKRDVASRGLAENVLFLGYLDRAKELPDCYRGADVLVFASNTETQGLVPLEAMASGTPVVSTAVLGTRAIIGPERGAVCAPEETEAFAAAVLRLLADADARRAKGAEARTYVAENWSSAAMAMRLGGVYDALTGREPVPMEDVESLPRSRFGLPGQGRERSNASR